MVHDPTLDAHEHIEHAEHAEHERDPFISRVTITIAVLAVLAATAGSLETVEGGRAMTSSSDAVLAQDKATDAWNEYQANSLKRHIYEIVADNGGAHAPAYKQDANDQRSTQGKVRETAVEDEKDRDRMLAASAAHES